MRKTKQNISLIIKPKHSQKPTEGKVPASTSKKNTKPKKTKQDAAHKENRSLSGFEDRPTHKMITPKKPVHRVKDKERSKSLLCQRKEGTVHELPLNQSHRQALLQYLKVRGEKEETDVSGHIHSIRYDKAYAEAETHSNFFSPCPVKANDTPFMRSELQTSAQPAPLPQFQLEDHSQFQQKNEKLKEKVVELEEQIEEVKRQAIRKEQLLKQSHALQQARLSIEIKQLKQEKVELSQQKYNLQCIICEQRGEINRLDEDKLTLQTKLHEEQKSKAQLMRSNNQSKLRIEALQRQLVTFEDNLSQFSKMRDHYEIRLKDLQSQKRKIKANACELLQMLHKYQQEREEID